MRGGRIGGKTRGALEANPAESDRDPGAALLEAGAGADPPPFVRAFYGQDVRMEAPSTYAELADIVQEAAARKRTVIPAGQGAHAYLGNPPPAGALVVSLRKLDRLLRYEPDDFTVGAQAGVPLASFREALAANRQEVPLDLPSRAPGTIGGLVAAAQPGPRRGRYGPARSHVIGVHAMRGDGTIYKAGGMVVKNVAGYEVAKLLTGSLGTAGILLEVNFKLRPLPRARSARLAGFKDAASAWELARAARSRKLEPAALAILRGPAARDAVERCGGPRPAAPGESWAAWILEGNRGSVAWQEKEFDSILATLDPRADLSLPTAERIAGLHDFLCEFPLPGLEARNDIGIARLGALPTEAARLEDAIRGAMLEVDPEPATVSDGLTGLVTARWSGPPDTVAIPVPRLEMVARRAEGSGVLLYLPPRQRPAHSHFLVPDPNRELARRVLTAFDPAGIFFPGRL